MNYPESDPSFPLVIDKKLRSPDCPYQVSVNVANYAKLIRNLKPTSNPSDWRIILNRDTPFAEWSTTKHPAPLLGKFNSVDSSINLYPEWVYRINPELPPETSLFLTKTLLHETSHGLDKPIFHETIQIALGLAVDTKIIFLGGSAINILGNNYGFSYELSLALAGVMAAAYLMQPARLAKRLTYYAHPFEIKANLLSDKLMANPEWQSLVTIKPKSDC